MPEYRRYNLTLRVVDPSAREKFRSLSRPESFFEIRPGRSPGERGAYSVEMTQEEYERALRDAANPDVNLIAVERDGYGHSGAVPDTKTLNFMAASNVDSLGLTGAGVDVAVVDSGIGPGLASGRFAGRIKASRSEVGENALGDTLGHGSAMAGNAVPAKARIVVSQVLDRNDNFSASQLARGLYWVTDEVGANIISLSLYYPAGSTVIDDALSHAASKNILIFALAGNGGQDNAGAGEGQVVYPGTHPNVLAITNYSIVTGEKALSSNWGDHVWAAAAGSGITRIKPDGSEEVEEDGGTSAATSVAAGIAALLITGGTSPGNVKKYLAETARKTGASPLYEGNGVLQLSVAYNKMRGVEPPPTDLDGGIPLSNGGQLTPQSGDLPGGLPPRTTVYPTGEPVYQGGGAFTLPEGGEAQFPTGEVVPLPEGYSSGPYPLSDGTQISPDRGTTPDPAPAPGYCDGPTGEGEAGEGPSYGYWIYTFEISAEAITVLTSGSGEYAWTEETDGSSTWLIPPVNVCKFYDAASKQYEIGILQGLGWWQTGGQLVRLCPPNSWWREF